MNNGSPLENALLGLLKQRPQSGYDLRKMFSTTPLRHFSDSPGSIYPALRRLQQRKWITVVRENGGGRKRQELRVTRAGEQALVRWLSKPVLRADVIWHNEQLMLRFAFMDGNVARSVTLRFLEQWEEVVSAYAMELRDYAKKLGSDLGTNTGGLAFLNGVESYEAHARWLRRVRKQLAEALI